MRSPSDPIAPKPRRLLTVLAALALVAAAGCSKNETPPNAPKLSSVTSGAAQALRAGAANAQALAHARDVKARYWARLEHEPGVFGMGIGWDVNGSVFIGVSVDKNQVGGIANIAREVEGIPVHIDVTGRPTFFAKPTPPPPIYMGTSSGNVNYCGGGGTVGCVVAAGRARYFLSCSHVFTPNNDQDLGANVSDPMPRLPNCAPQPIIGKVSDFTPRILGETHTMDAAIATVAKGLNYTTAMYTGYTPTSTVTPESAGLAVKKTGARTGLRSGTVTMIHYDAYVGAAFFTDQMYIGTTDFALPGDSGALVVTETENNPVGIVIGGDSGGSYTIATPIQRILDRFGVTVAQ